MPDQIFWNERYLQGDTGWDMGQVSPPLQAYFDQLSAKDQSILIPGCGNSYEAAYLLNRGFTHITLLDISPVLVDRLKQKFGQKPALQLLQADFFDHQGQYDLIIEQTFFCALDPTLRPAYVEKMQSLLKPRGKLVGVLFDRDFSDGITERDDPGGPPFGGHKQEYQTLLEKRFRIKTLEPCYNSIPPRAGAALFLIAEKPGKSEKPEKPKMPESSGNPERS